MKFLTEILDGWESVYNAIRYRFDDYEWWEWNRDFWEEISIGWYQEYIFPYEKYETPFISKERQLRLAQKPSIIYLSSNDFDELCQRLDEPVDPAIIRRVEKVLKNQPSLKKP